MTVCTSCGKKISPHSAEGIRERDQSYHIGCAPNDLLDDSVAEWKAIYDRGVKYFVKKYSTHVDTKSGGQRGNFSLFVDMGRTLTAESKKRKG